MSEQRAPEHPHDSSEWQAHDGSAPYVRPRRGGAARRVCTIALTIALAALLSMALLATRGSDRGADGETRSSAATGSDSGTDGQAGSSAAPRGDSGTDGQAGRPAAIGSAIPAAAAGAAASP